MTIRYRDPASSTRWSADRQAISAVDPEMAWPTSAGPKAAHRSRRHSGPDRSAAPAGRVPGQSGARQRPERDRRRRPRRAGRPPAPLPRPAGWSAARTSSCVRRPCACSRARPSRCPREAGTCASSASIAARAVCSASQEVTASWRAVSVARRVPAAAAGAPASRRAIAISASPPSNSGTVSRTSPDETGRPTLPVAARLGLSWPRAAEAARAATVWVAASHRRVVGCRGQRFLAPGRQPGGMWGDCSFSGSTPTVPRKISRALPDRDRPGPGCAGPCAPGAAGPQSRTRSTSRRAQFAGRLAAQRELGREFRLCWRSTSSTFSARARRHKRWRSATARPVPLPARWRARLRSGCGAGKRGVDPARGPQRHGDGDCSHWADAGLGLAGSLSLPRAAPLVAPTPAWPAGRPARRQRLRHSFVGLTLPRLRRRAAVLS